MPDQASPFRPPFLLLIRFIALIITTTVYCIFRMAGDLVSRSRSGPPSSSHVVAFQEKLRETRSTCAWLDQQLETPSKSFNPARAARLIRRSSPQDALPAKSATQEAVESATTQIVNRALRLLKKDNGSGAEGGEASHPPQTPDATSIGSKVGAHDAF